MTAGCRTGPGRPTSSRTPTTSSTKSTPYSMTNRPPERDQSERELWLTHGTEGAPGAGGELQVEAGVGVAEVVAGDLPDPLQPVPQCAAVHGEGLGRGVVAAAALQVYGER